MHETDTAFPILIVDDDAGHIELIRRNLRRLAISNPIDTLQEGASALDYLFRRGRFSERTSGTPLTLLDINMPGAINGIEVLRQIKSHEQTRKIPVIMLSTSDDPREIARCYDLGCSVYMAKPVDPNLFIESIKRLGLFLQVIRLAKVEEEHERCTA